MKFCSDKLKIIFYIIYTLNISHKITEKNYIFILNQLNTLGFNIISIKGIELLLFMLSKLKFNTSYIFSMIYYLKNNYNKNIIELKNNYNALSKFIKNSTKNNNISEILIIKSFISDKYILLKSFIKMPFIINNELDLNIHNHQPQHKHEIINRLFQLRKNFDMDILNYINIQFISLSDSENMTYFELQNYYINCINLIQTRLKNILNILNTLLTANLLYKECINNIILNNNYELYINISNLKFIYNIKS